MNLTNDTTVQSPEQVPNNCQTTANKTPYGKSGTLSQKLRYLGDPESNESPQLLFSNVRAKKEIIQAQGNRLVDKTNTLSKKLFKGSNKLAKSLSAPKIKKQFFVHLNLKAG